MKTWIPLPATGYGTAATNDGRWLLVAMHEPGQVAVVDLRSLKVVRLIDVPKSPSEVMVRPDGKVAYVSCGKKVAAINLAGDVATWKADASIDAGDGADGLAWGS